MPTARTALRIPPDVLTAIDRKAGPGNRTSYIVGLCRKDLGLKAASKPAAKASREVTPIQKSGK